MIPLCWSVVYFYPVADVDNVTSFAFLAAAMMGKTSFGVNQRARVFCTSSIQVSVMGVS